MCRRRLQGSCSVDIPSEKVEEVFVPGFFFRILIATLPFLNTQIVPRATGIRRGEVIHIYSRRASSSKHEGPSQHYVTDKDLKSIVDVHSYNI